jgi:hypothetical protein
MGMTTNIIRAASASIDKLFEDKNLVRQITWQWNAGQSFDDENQVSSNVYLDYHLPGIYTEKEKFAVPSPGESRVQTTEAAFLVRVSDLPEGFSKSDKIINAEGESFRIERNENMMDYALRVVVKGI